MLHTRILLPFRVGVRNRPIGKMRGTQLAKANVNIIRRIVKTFSKEESALTNGIEEKFTLVIFSGTRNGKFEKNALPVNEPKQIFNGEMFKEVITAGQSDDAFFIRNDRAFGFNVANGAARMHFVKREARNRKPTFLGFKGGKSLPTKSACGTIENPTRLIIGIKVIEKDAMFNGGFEKPARFFIAAEKVRVNFVVRGDRNGEPIIFQGKSLLVMFNTVALFSFFSVVKSISGSY